MTTYYLHLSHDPTAIGEAATRDDLRLYADQLASELSDEFDVAIEARLESLGDVRVTGPDGEICNAVRRRVREIHAGDDWIQVLRRSDAVA